ncbi:MAG: dihydrofolate reductase family protein [Solirubrobacterales bacterium]
MRRIVVTEFVSLDGVMEDPGGSEDTPHGGWSFKFQDPEGMKYKLEEVMEHDAMLLGRVTFEGFAEAWPDRSDEAGFADKMNSMKKYVVSSTLESPEWENSEVLGANLEAEVARIKEEPGQDILVAGSASLVHALTAAELVDEYRLMLFPIVLGDGKRVFGDSTDATVLELADSKVLDSGTVILTYHRAEG